MSSNPFTPPVKRHPRFNPIKTPKSLLKSTTSSYNTRHYLKPVVIKDLPFKDDFSQPVLSLEKDDELSMKDPKEKGDEKDDGDDVLLAKLKAKDRFSQNNRLINEVLNGKGVPDYRDAVSTVRLRLLRGQVNDLRKYVGKHVDELKEFKRKSDAKKRKIMENTEKFQKEMERSYLIKPTDPQTFETMVDHFHREIMGERNFIEGIQIITSN